MIIPLELLSANSSISPLTVNNDVIFVTLTRKNPNTWAVPPRPDASMQIIRITIVNPIGGPSGVQIAEALKKASLPGAAFCLRQLPSLPPLMVDFKGCPLLICIWENVALGDE